ncbi:hypothetical protein BKA62DRAFT_623344, partial [Auriculariales sp. MPI-PUGE-AT-0066]
DIHMLHTFAMRHELGLTERQYTKMSRFQHTAPNPPTKRTCRRLACLSDVNAVKYDCCINSCCCFTGSYAGSQTCPICDEPRFGPQGHARQSFSYLPFTAWLLALFAHRQQSQDMRYRAEQPDRGGSEFNDYTDGSHYRRLRTQHVFIEGHGKSYLFFSKDTDVALALSADGFNPFKKKR